MAALVRKNVGRLNQILKFCFQPKLFINTTNLGGIRKSQLACPEQVNHFSSTSAPVTITDSCVKRLKEVATGDQKYLRVVVDGGGCSGFQYVFSLDNTINEDDSVIEKDGATILIDKASLQFMEGSTIDFAEELIRSSFRVISNPKAEKGCSCGASFNVKGLD